jgi:DNA-binding transcriptional LysR family regulator
MDLRTFDFNLLKVLDALIVERNVTRAAERLGRSQPAISNSLRRLRRILGDDLLIRGQDGLVLTSRAEALRGALNAAIASIENCVVEGSSFDPAKASGVIRMCMPGRVGLAVLPPLLARIKRLAPGLALQVTTADRQQALDLHIAGRIDLSLGWIDDKPGHLQFERMMDEGFFCVFRPDHPIQKGRFDIKTVLSYSHLVVSATGDGRSRFDDLLKPHGLHRHILIAVTTFTPVGQLLLCSDMIGVFTTLAAESLRASSGVEIRPVPIDIGNVSTTMAWPVRFEQDKQHAWLREQLRIVYADLTSTQKPLQPRSHRLLLGNGNKRSRAS